MTRSEAVIAELEKRIDLIERRVGLGKYAPVSKVAAATVSDDDIPVEHFRNRPPRPLTEEQKQWVKDWYTRRQQTHGKRVAARKKDNPFG